MAELKNCPQCGRLFPYMGKRICRKCQELEEDQYMLVRRYVRDNPGSGIFEVSEETGVEKEKIINFLREGRLESRGLKSSGYSCKGCGKNISEGIYCSKCNSQLDSDFKGALTQKSEPALKINPRTGDRMYTRDKKH